MTEEDYQNFVKGIPSGPFTQRDVELAGDVRCCQLVLDALVRTIGAKSILEIGTADGSTTIALLHAAHITGGSVVSCDPSMCEDAIALVNRCGYESRWRFERMRSDELFERGLCPKVIDFAYIDGDHASERVYQDFVHASALLREGGIIVSHDWATASPRDMDAMAKREQQDAVFGAARGILRAIPLSSMSFCMPLLAGSQYDIRGENAERNMSEGGFCIFTKANRWDSMEYYRRIAKGLA